ncbi:MAG TPA: 2OG-Fe(II) oxygenase [Acidimicrobiales bacterium]|jgi:Rps23 Pro-64 3,4-dihydroxylase Tpa1-like proline 4-hydroxylase|nr:2OG-Fe(II) oxygenase [Acidimicrobiales bacterium]
MEQVYFLDYSEWERLGLKHRDDFASARPFPHVVIDNALPADVLKQVVDELPSPEDWEEHDDWTYANRADAIKRSIPNDWDLGPVTRHLLNQFNSAVFVNFLEKLTGIEGLLPDPYYFGGGVHQIERGGFLKIHADFNVHHRLKVDRRLNALLYLNEGWQDEWGGNLELWDASMENAVERIPPIFNRLVVFATTDTSFHGHPDPLTCPVGVRRRSLALYYYTNGRPEQERSEPHSTLHQVRPGEDFDPYPTQAPEPEPAPAPATSMSADPPSGPSAPSSSPNPRRKPITWRDFVPPIATRAKRYLTPTTRR